MLDGFQAGLAWITVLRKREAFRLSFAGFDPEKVARFGEQDILRLLDNPGIIRSRAKIEATIGAARIYRSEEHTSELQSLMRISYAVFCLKKKKKHKTYLNFITSAKSTNIQYAAQQASRTHPSIS